MQACINFEGLFLNIKFVELLFHMRFYSEDRAAKQSTILI